MPSFSILGPLEAATDDGSPIPLGGPKQRAVLAVLLLRAGQVVGSDHLVSAVWGENPPKNALASLQNSVAALRKAFGEGGEAILRTRGRAYFFDPESASLDLRRCEQLRAEAGGQGAIERARLLREALDLWTGEPLAEFGYEPFRDDIRYLEELRLLVHEEWIDAELECGRGPELVPHLESLVLEHWDRERLIEQLMVALYRAGRQNDAISRYNAAYRRFVDELGCQPGPRLQRVYADIIRQAPNLLPTAESASPAEHVEEVAALVLEGKLVPVLGADVAELAAHLAARFGYPPDEPSDLTRVAQYVAMTKGSGPLYDELNEMLAVSVSPGPVHRFFASLPRLLRDRRMHHQLLVTTGYDLALEQAFLEAEEEFDVVTYVASGRDRGRFCHVEPDGTTHVVQMPNTYATELSLERRTAILKLHGGVELERFVVTEDDYIGYLTYGDVGGAIPVGLAAKLRRSHFLFLGYAMRDWNLRLVLDRMWGSGGASYRSWAVQPTVKPIERQFWRARDVDVLDVPLDEYTAALARQLELTARAPA